MRKKIFAVAMMLFTMVLGAAFCSAPLRAAEFSADINQRLQGRALTGRIFVKGGKYRVEQRDANGRRMFIIVDQKADLTIVLDPAEKRYMETPSTGMLSLMNDPFQSARYMETKFKKTLLGKEMISGYECTKFKLESDNKELMTVWKAKKLNFALKISLHDKKQSFVELKNIKEGPIDEARFRVPAGYNKQEDRAKKREREEAALPVITTSVKGEAPWARRIEKGGEIRVKVDPKKSVRFRFENLVKDESVFTIKAFRNGRPIKMDIKETYSLRHKGQREKPLLGLQNKADEIAIRVEKGKILAHIMNEQSAFAKDKIKTFFITTGLRKFTQGKFVDPKRQFRLIITSDSQDSTKSRIKVKFYKGDYKNKVDEVEAVLPNGQSKTWEYPAAKGIKTLEIAVAKGGGVKVRIEQPAPGKSLKSKRAPKIIRTASSKQGKKSVTKAVPQKQPGPRLSRKQARKIIKAINANDVAVVESELDKGMNINSMLYGGTLLMKAANLGTAEMVKMLISRGANLNYRTRRGDDALSVGMSNSRHWQQVVPILVEAGITVDENTPIWKIGFKTKKGKLLPEAKKMLEFLFAKGASPDSYTTQEKSTLIMFYAKKGWLDPLKFFLDHGADVNARTIKGQTALSMALTKPRRPEKPAQKKERQAVVELLRSRGAK
ncbi:MAG: DUF4412 domain-containing protein [Deltaproteobacteria bacterium]|nr:DUF4412 domain-containing protein [Deltaproteobacteria bacterium]